MPEVQDVFRTHGDAYRRAHQLSHEQLKVLDAISKCRTAELGAHIDECESCGVVEISYNSCRNRHCPKCQSFAKERWIDNQKHNLLNTPYFHVVFTVPAALRPVFYQNQRTMYNLLFRASAETLQELAADKKYLGAKIGFSTILHTWGQNLSYHPHVHCIVAAGGLTELGSWVSSGNDFFIPVRVLSRKFRGKFLHHLNRLSLDFFGEQAHLSDPLNFKNFVASCYGKEWVVYCKPPFKSPASVVDYLGRYTHRVAISNDRMLRIEDGEVTFKWRDYKDGSKWKNMTVTAEDFIRRFLMHVLPAGFVKIRHYGFLGNRDKDKRLAICKRLTNTPILPKAKASALDLLCAMIGRDVSLCRHCGKPRHPVGLSPPLSA